MLPSTGVAKERNFEAILPFACSHCSFSCSHLYLRFTANFPASHHATSLEKKTAVRSGQATATMLRPASCNPRAGRRWPRAARPRPPPAQAGTATPPLRSSSRLPPATMHRPPLHSPRAGRSRVPRELAASAHPAMPGCPCRRAAPRQAARWATAED